VNPVLTSQHPFMRRRDPMDETLWIPEQIIFWRTNLARLAGLGGSRLIESESPTILEHSRRGERRTTRKSHTPRGLAFDGFARDVCLGDNRKVSPLYCQDPRTKNFSLYRLLILSTYPMTDPKGTSDNHVLLFMSNPERSGDTKEGASADRS